MNLADVTRAAFGGLAPVGHMLRGPLSARWMRIHSLPNAKRYPESADDWHELLLRQNDVALTILGDGSPAVLCLHSFGPGLKAYSSLAWFDRLSSVECVISRHVPPDDDAELVVRRYHIRWAAGAWDDLLRSVAEWEVPSAVIVNPSSHEAFAPYDGGADIFFAHDGRRKILADRWRPWLSARDDGL